MATWVAAVSDIHSGSTVAVFPKEGCRLDDGGTYLPSPAQSFLGTWWEEVWHQAIEQIGADPWHLILNGDLVDGDHHNTPQIISRLPGPEHKGCISLLRNGPLKGKPKSIHVIRGTESHVGRSGKAEEAIAAVLAAGDDDYPGVPVIPDPEIGTKSTFWRRVEIEGVLFDCRHHGRIGQRSHTRESFHRLYAHDIWEEHVLNDERPPDFCLRGHHHKFVDSGYHRKYPRVVTLPCWQLATAYTHKIAIESLPDIGIVLFRIENGQVEVQPILLKLDRPKVVNV